MSYVTPNPLLVGQKINHGFCNHQPIEQNPLTKPKQTLPKEISS
jgi:hypothetical protein